MEQGDRIPKFLRRKNIDPKCIKYILHEKGKTNLYLSDGRMISTYITSQDIISVLNEDDFFNINRGMYVAISEVVSIEGNAYTMADGTVLTGRAYKAEEHEKNRIRLLNQDPQSRKTLSVYDRFSGLNDMSVPFCVLEIMTREDKNIDFIIRYANSALAAYDKKPLSELLGNSVYDIYEEGDMKALAQYANVATTGKERIVTKKDPETGSTVSIYCYRPFKNLCACMLKSI